MIERLNRARMSWRDYLDHAAISSGFLGDVLDEGLGPALHRRAAGAQLATDPRMAKGTVLHAWLTEDPEARTLVAHGPPKSTTPTNAAKWGWTDSEDIGPPVKVRRGKDWEWAKAQAIQRGAHALLLEHEHQDLLRSYESLLRADTPAKAEILAIFRRWEPRFPEVSHIWETAEVPGCECRIREDTVVQAPGGVWCAVQIKSTEAPLATWMRRFWPRYVRRSSAFYRQGLLDLFGETPFVQLLVVARLVPPYPWAIFSLADHGETFDHLWQTELVPALQDITESLARGEAFGPGERGLFS